MSYKRYSSQNRVFARKMRHLIIAKMAEVMELCDHDAELDALEGHVTWYHHLDLLDGVHVYP